MTKFDLTHKSNLLFIMARKVPTNDSFFKVLAYVLKETRENGEFTHAHVFTARACGVSSKTINRVMKKICEYQLYERLDINDGYGKRYIYQITQYPIWDSVIETYRTELSQDTSVPSQISPNNRKDVSDPEDITVLDSGQNIPTTKTSKDLSKTSNKPLKKNNLSKKDREAMKKSSETLKRFKNKVSS